MNEEWRSFREGTYEVSNLGNIRRAVPGISTYVGRPLLPAHSPTGYAHAAFTIGGKPVRVYVHRMVLEAFVGPCPSGHVVNHLNGQRSPRLGTSSPARTKQAKSAAKGAA